MKIMKVICIDASLKSDELPYKGFHLVEGDIYTVVGERRGFNISDEMVGICYDLLEDFDNFLWSKDKFIPLSTIEESELEEQITKIEVLI